MIYIYKLLRENIDPRGNCAWSESFCENLIRIYARFPTVRRKQRKIQKVIPTFAFGSEPTTTGQRASKKKTFQPLIGPIYTLKRTKNSFFFHDYNQF